MREEPLMIVEVISLMVFEEINCVHVAAWQLLLLRRILQGDEDVFVLFMDLLRSVQRSATEKGALIVCLRALVWLRYH